MAAFREGLLVNPCGPENSALWEDDDAIAFPDFFPTLPSSIFLLYLLTSSFSLPIIQYAVTHIQQQQNSSVSVILIVQDAGTTLATNSEQNVSINTCT